MFNLGWDHAIGTAAHDLNPSGIIAVVAFSHTRAPWFERWMGINPLRLPLASFGSLSSVQNYNRQHGNVLDTL
jgi:hypothetical protein